VYPRRPELKRIAILLVTVMLPCCSMASDNSIFIAENDSQRSIAQNLSMTTESLLKAYMSKDIEQRRLAEMYVVGVIDSSEGESWCGFKIASPDALQEQVYVALKRTAEKSPKERPSRVIKSHLKELLPCKEKQ